MPWRCARRWLDTAWFIKTQLAQRIKQLGGLTWLEGVTLGNQTQPGEDTTDVIGVIEAVIAEDAACKHYRKIIQATEGDDYVTQDTCITLLGDEEEHLCCSKAS
jgi:bacterioferritin